MCCVPDDVPEWRAILEALIGGPSAWRTPAQLAAGLGREVEDLTDVLADLDVAGWLDVWERPEGPSVTLTAWAAGRLNVRLAEWGGLSFRWVDASLPVVGAPRARGVTASAALEELDLVADPAPGPEALLEAFEAWAARPAVEPGSARPAAADRAPSGPYPTRLVGQGLTPWPGPAAAADRGCGGPEPACPACRGRSLTGREYCLGCDRWGGEAPGSAGARAAAARLAAIDPAQRLARERAAAARQRSRRRARRRAHLLDRARATADAEARRRAADRDRRRRQGLRAARPAA